MTDSEDASHPSESTIEDALKAVVAGFYRTNKHSELTVKRVRAAAETRLDLPAEFLKAGSWRDKSKEIITEAVQSHEPDEDRPANDHPAPTEEKRKDAPIKPVKSSSHNHKPRGKKRPSPSATKKPQKRRKIVASSDEEESDLTSPPADEDVASRADHVEEDEMNNADTVQAEEEKPAPEAIDSESELSSLIDDGPPPPKKRGKQPASAKAPKEPKNTKSSKTSASKDKGDIDPQDVEIKRLQGWLVKCGIRKMWYKELSPFNTKKARINHLKDMLKDAGMDGRYSQEKATQIKERRELAADLQEVQEGNKRWGQDGSGDESDKADAEAKPRKRLAKGLASLPQFSDDDDSE